MALEDSVAVVLMGKQLDALSGIFKQIILTVLLATERINVNFNAIILLSRMHKKVCIGLYC